MPHCLYWHDSASKYWILIYCFEVFQGFVLIIGVAYVLVTVLSKWGAVVIGHEINYG